MLSSLHFMILGFQALLRNRVQTALALVGVMVGVSALVASVALGRGAQESIKDQLLAAGANMIVVTAGNYAPQRTQGTEAPADHGYVAPPVNPRESVARLLAVRSELVERGYSTDAIDEVIAVGVRLMNGSSPGRFVRTHFEDDPNAVHDHPTAKERLGDSMAGLGAAATLTLDDADAIRERIPGVQFAAAGVHENARVTVEGEPAKQWFTRLHGTEAKLPGIRRGWIYPYGAFLTERHVQNAEQVMVLGHVAAEKLFGAGVDPVGRSILLWNQPFKVVGVVSSTSWAAQPVAGDDQFDAIYVPVTTVHRLLNLSKLNTITVTTASAGDTTRIAGEITELLRQRHGITETMPDDFTVKTQAQEMLGKGLSPELARIVGGNLATVEQLTLEQLSASLQRSNRTM
ncbi:MAG: ABC transporter permease, partial [Pseudomonadota bacterium]|nr:ABC transporter permease [Pseudomonadota bacterium]